MKKYVVILIVSAVSLFLVYFLYSQFTYEFDSKSGIKQEELSSPTGKYTAQVYFQSYGGAAGGVNVYVTVIFHLEGEVEKMVYYSDAKSKFNINWIDEDQLSVTNLGEYEDSSIILTVGKEIYDESGKACSKYSIKKAYTCYSKKNPGHYTEAP